MIYEGITRKEYNALEGINASRLKNYFKSTAYGQFKDSEPRTETPAMRFGTMVHSMILEPEKFPNEYLLMPEAPKKDDGKPLSKNSNAYKDWFKSLPSDKILYSKEESDLLERIQTGVECHKLALELLESCPKRELAVTWELNGVKFKSLIDMLGDEVVADLKTTREIPIRFTNGEFDLEKTQEAIKWKLLVDTGNVLQAYHYFEGCRKNDLPVTKFKFLFAENNSACNIAVANVCQDTMLIGKQMRNTALNNLLNENNLITFPNELEL